MHSFNDLTIIDLIVGLTDLLNEVPSVDRPARAAALRLADGDGFYRARLDKLLGALRALPPSEGQRPLRELLKAADASFDRDGRLLRLAKELLGLLTHPTEGAKAAAASIEEIVPKGITLASYAAEAQHAMEVARALDLHKAALEAVALPDEATPTLFAVVERFVASGVELDKLGSARGETVALRGDRAGAGALRSQAIGTLHALRAHVALALDARPDLGPDLDGRIFGYLDELQHLAAGRAAGAPGAVAPTPSEPTPTPASEPTA